MSENENAEVVSFRISPSVYGRVKVICIITGTDFSALMRMLVDRFLEESTKDAKLAGVFEEFMRL